ncbi:MAG: 2-hydroxyacid dehydrogenase [Granulosicoccus sp.]
MSMIIALHMPSAERLEWWAQQLSELLPEYRVLAHSDIEASTDVEIAVVWRPPNGWLATLPNLKLTVSIGAGIDHIVQDPSYPANIPVLKTTGPDMIQRMREYVVLNVLRFHRELPTLVQQQSEQRWKSVITPTAQQRQVGIMGMGGMGTAASKSLVELGFKVRCWSRNSKTINGIQSFSGLEQLENFLEQTEILVCLLPLTEDTKEILCSGLFNQLPKGACLINAARGQHLAEQDLLDALNNGQLSQATLDVFTTEPLPEGHPFWQHPDILVTPHIASLIDPVSGGKIIAANIKRFAQGDMPDGLTEAYKGY